MSALIAKLKTHFPLPLLDALRRLPIVRSQRLLVRLMETTGELEAFFRAELFPDIPAREHRVELMALMIGTGAAEAMYILDSLYKSIHLSGDVCEFGVAQGLTSALFANELHSTDKDLWLFDTFRGLPAPSEEDVLLDDIFGLKSMQGYEGTMAFGPAGARRRVLATGFPEHRLHIVEGLIESLPSDVQLPAQVCFAYLDFDLYRPTATALALLDEKLASGGRIVVDDYGFFSSGPERAVQEFLNTHSTYRLLQPNLPAGKFAILEKLPSPHTASSRTL